MSKILVIGDTHSSEHLRYHRLIVDGRESEKKEVLDFIVKTFEDNACDGVVFLGDQFDKRNNPSSVVKAFTEFLERFDGKPVYMIAGNHDLLPTGDSALDYLKEIKGKNWHIITNTIEYIDGMLFCPYFFKAQLGVETDEEATKELMLRLHKKDIRGNITPLFTHFAISDSLTTSGQNTNLFSEIVLNNETLHKFYNPVFGGHIHKPNERGDDQSKTIVAGSIFNEEIGEDGKNIYIFNTEDCKVETIALPGRKVCRIENPEIKDLKKYDKNSILKVFISDRSIDIEEIRKELEKFDGHVIVEQYPNERRSDVYQGELIDLTIENLLKMYSKHKKIDEKILMSAWNKIK